METSADEVRSTFLVTQEAKDTYYRWENNPRRAEVVSTMRDHTTKAIYDCTLDDFKWIKAHHTHPLGTVRKKDIEHIAWARDWNPRFAFVHLFHLLLEHLNRPPLWSEFDRFVCETETGMNMFGTEREELENRIFTAELRRLRARPPAGKDPESEARRLAKASLDWRVGNAYYGFMREMYTAVALRERGVNVKVHPLADANFRTDGWAGQNILSIFVINPKYKVADQQRAERRQQGRKTAVEKLFPNSEFSFVELTMERAEHFGEFHFPSEEAIEEVSGKLWLKGC
ncbi:hypothetical protein OG439_40725 [Amycolatopsis sp. NBC_01307]|uniref:hypothetical protein n=1 Tax=Amycolatopsis sp. NBC_01307 TaxID=2903561 RepID=UPI002E129A47|nr:hypothetical protein OG439_40725 [Amycolatopsis sp. NBC_01307]